jgi:hypothetical protein
MAHAHAAYADDAFGELVAGGGKARPAEYVAGHYAECSEGAGCILEEFPPVGKVFFLHDVLNYVKHNLISVVTWESCGFHRRQPLLFLLTPRINAMGKGRIKIQFHCNKSVGLG